MPSPYLCKCFHPTCGCSQRKSLFLNFANATPRMQFAKVAPPGFERETEIVVARALTSVATRADLLVFLRKIVFYQFLFRYCRYVTSKTWKRSSLHLPLRFQEQNSLDCLTHSWQDLFLTKFQRSVRQKLLAGSHEETSQFAFS